MSDKHEVGGSNPSGRTISDVDFRPSPCKPTVSPSTIPLVYYHIKSFQQASSVERPWPGGENRAAGRASHHEQLCSDWVVSPPVWTAGVSLIAVWGLIGATPRGQPWTPAVTLPHRRDGLSARRMAVLWTFREPSLRRHVHREFMHNAVLDLTPIIPTTACHQRNYVERYSRFTLKTGAPAREASLVG
jgi:hypothetical protein